MMPAESSRSSSSRQGAFVPTAAEGLAQVVVGVDGGETRLLYMGGFGDELGLGAEIAEVHDKELYSGLEE